MVNKRNEKIYTIKQIEIELTGAKRETVRAVCVLSIPGLLFDSEVTEAGEVRWGMRRAVALSLL